MRAILIVFVSLFVSRCAPTSYTADPPPQNERESQGSASHGYHPPAPTTEYEEPLLSIFQPDEGAQYPFVGDTCTIWIYPRVWGEAMVADTANLRLSWSYGFGGPYTPATRVIVRQFLDRDLYAIEWKCTRDDFDLSAWCTQIHLIVTAPDSTGQWHISYPWYCFFTVVDMPMCLEVPTQFVSGDTLRGPLVPFAAKLSQPGYDLREVRSVDLWVKHHEDLDQRWFWERVDQGTVSDTLFGDDALITRWRWYINTLTYTEGAYDFRLVPTYADGTVALDCDHDGQFDDNTFWMTGKDYMIIGEGIIRGCTAPQTFIIRH